MGNLTHKTLKSLMKFDEVEPPSQTRTGSGPWQKMLTAKDLNFVGYTYKNFDAVKGLHSSVGKILIIISLTFWIVTRTLML